MCTERGACDAHLYASYDDVPDFEGMSLVPTKRRTAMARASRTTILRQQLNAIAEELARLESRPAEPPPGTVIRFEMQFSDSGVRYTYAAIHAGGGWYTTGKGPQRATWDALMDWMQGCTTNFEILRPTARVLLEV